MRDAALGLQVYRFTGLQVYRFTGLQVYRFTDLLVYRDEQVLPLYSFLPCICRIFPYIVSCMLHLAQMRSLSSLLHPDLPGIVQDLDMAIANTHPPP